MLTSAYPLYTLHFPRYWLVRDGLEGKTYAPTPRKLPHESALFHVAAGDYLTTLATILKFFEESVFESEMTPEMRALQLKTIRDVIEDLLYLNIGYTITPKNKNFGQ